MGNNEDKGLSWYSCEGNDSDVIVSTRVRLARNLANFPFPSCYKFDDYKRVHIITLSAFSQLKDAQDYHSIETYKLDQQGALILTERGVLEKGQSGIVMRNDGFLAASINVKDHLHISSFRTGLNIRKCFDEAMKLDEELQQNLQFAASYSFGYLTHSLKDCGSGMKLSARVHLPAAVYVGKLSLICDYCKESQLSIKPAYPEISQGSAAGHFYQISTENSFNGNQLDQVAAFEACCRFIAETERKISADYADNKSTLIRNSVIRAYSIAKFSLLVSLREAVDIISDIKFGLKLGFVRGIDDSVLSSLLYRVQKGHLSYLMKSGEFDFEEDIQNDERAKIDRLRAITLQEAFENISLGKL